MLLHDHGHDGGGSTAAGYSARHMDNRTLVRRLDQRPARFERSDRLYVSEVI